MTSATASTELERALATATGDSRIMVVLAHPDDETLGCGAQLSRWPDAKVVIVTDGAPRDGADARAHGFADWQQYGAARLRELHDAMACAGIAADRIILLGLPDQEVAQHIPQLVATLIALLKAYRPHLVLTHAYEGGHPDHDATCLAVHASTRGRDARIELAEMPLYRAAPDGTWLCQSFHGSTPHTQTVALDPIACQLKRRMLAAYSSQAQVLAAFDPTVERYRRAPDYDFTQCPNDGNILYTNFPWGIDRQHWLRAVAQARFATRDCAA